MALHAVAEIGYILMFVCDFGLVMTVVTGPCGECRRVAGGAVAVGIAVRHREGVGAGVGCIPIGGGMTGCAIGAK